MTFIPFGRFMHCFSTFDLDFWIYRLTYILGKFNPIQEKEKKRESELIIRIIYDNKERMTHSE